MKAKLKIVYSEERYGRDSKAHLVRVEIRRWSGQSVRYEDTVLEATVIVDGELVVHSLEHFDRYQSTTQMQRHGIKVFDELLLSHPVLSPEANKG